MTAANAAKYHFLGDFKKAFAYMENWPITVTRAPTNGDTNPVLVPVPSFNIVEIGDLVMLSAGAAAPASDLADTEAGNQEPFHDVSIGVVIQQSRSGETAPKRLTDY